MDMNIENKVALVTGGSKGIGFGIASSLASEGVGIVLLSRDLKSLNTAKEKIINNGGNVLEIIEADLSDPLIDKVVEKKLNLKKIIPDILVNNSGGPPFGTYLEHNKEIWNKYFDQNLLSIIKLVSLLTKDMTKKKWGRVINVTSTNAIEPSSEMVISSTLRSAVAAFSKSVSLTLAKTGVTINTICPGGVSTDRLINLINIKAKKNKTSPDYELKNAEKSIPMGRFATPQELASLVTFLCSSNADYLTGQVFPFDGGLVKGFK